MVTLVIDIIILKLNETSSNGPIVCMPSINIWVWRKARWLGCSEAMELSKCSISKSPEIVTELRIERNSDPSSGMFSKWEKRTARLGEGSSDGDGRLRLDLQGSGCFEGERKGDGKSNGGEERKYPIPGLKPMEWGSTSGLHLGSCRRQPAFR